MLGGCPQIRIDQQSPLAQLREDHREIGCQAAAALTGACRGHYHRLSLVIEPAQEQLAAQRSQRLGARSERVVHSEQARVRRRLAGREARIPELLCERRLHLLLGQQTEVDRSLAETQISVCLCGQDSRDILFRQFARIEQLPSERPADAVIRGRESLLESTGDTLHRAVSASLEEESTGRPRKQRGTATVA